MLIISVHLAHVFDRWTLTAPKVSRPLQLVLSGGPVTPTPIGEYNGLRGENRGPFKGQQASASNPVMWLWLARLYVREALPHMLPATRYSATSWPTIPRGYSTAPQPVHTGRRPGSDWPVGQWTRVQDSPTVASTVTRTRILLAPNWDLVSPILCTKNHVISYRGTLRIWPVFVPLWSGRGRAGKKLTAVTFFRCPIVTRPGGKYVNAVGADAHKTWLVGWIDLWTQGWCHGPDRRLHLGHPIYC